MQTIKTVLRGGWQHEQYGMVSVMSLDCGSNFSGMDVYCIAETGNDTVAKKISYWRKH